MLERPGRLNGLRHIALLVPDLEACERFYVDILGMGRASVPSSGEQAVDHYGFIVDSIDELHAWYAYFKAYGVTLLDRPFAHGDGAHSFHLLDPAGNKVQPIYHPAVSGQRFSSTQ